MQSTRSVLISTGGLQVCEETAYEVRGVGLEARRLCKGLEDVFTPLWSINSSPQPVFVLMFGQHIRVIKCQTYASTRPRLRTISIHMF